MVLLPIDIKAEGRRCLIVGGGEVAWRKVQALLEARAAVTVVSPEINPGLMELVHQRKLDWQEREFVADDVKGCILAIAATSDREVNKKVAKAAEEHNVLVNVVDDPELCRCYFPSYFRRGKLLITVSTSGASPALSAALRRDIEKGFGLHAAQAIEIIEQYREKALQEIKDTESRMKFWNSFFTPEILALIRHGDPEQLEEVLDSAYRSYRAES